MSTQVLESEEARRVWEEAIRQQAERLSRMRSDQEGHTPARASKNFRVKCGKVTMKDPRP